MDVSTLNRLQAIVDGSCPVPVFAGSRVNCSWSPTQLSAIQFCFGSVSSVDVTTKLHNCALHTFMARDRQEWSLQVPCFAHLMSLQVLVRDKKPSVGVNLRCAAGAIRLLQKRDADIVFQWYLRIPGVQPLSNVFGSLTQRSASFGCTTEWQWNAMRFQVDVIYHLAKRFGVISTVTTPHAKATVALCDNFSLAGSIALIWRTWTLQGSFTTQHWISLQLEKKFAAFTGGLAVSVRSRAIPALGFIVDL